MAESSKLIRPLFYGRYFNRDGRRMRAVHVKTVSNNTNSYRLWRSAGKPDRDYTKVESDKYYLHAEINGYLAPLGMTEHFLIERCGSKAVDERYGGSEARRRRFDELRKSGGDEAYFAALDADQNETARLGSDPARQADYIHELLDGHVQTYLKSRECGGHSFPDFVGALVLDDLARCTELSAVYRAMREEEQRTRYARMEAEDKEFCKEKNSIAEQAVSDAIQVIRDGGVLENGKVTFYRSKYDASAYSIVLYLMRLYHVDVPPRTQGWINEKLIHATVKDGRCCHVQYLRGRNGRCSEKVFDCMDKLIRAVREQAETSNSEEPPRTQKGGAEDS